MPRSISQSRRIAISLNIWVSHTDERSILH
jgi:hypothetical protein